MSKAALWLVECVLDRRTFWLRQRLLFGFYESASFISDIKLCYNRGYRLFLPIFLGILDRIGWRVSEKHTRHLLPDSLTLTEETLVAGLNTVSLLERLHVEPICFSISEESAYFPHPATSSWRNSAPNMEALLKWE